MDTAGKRLSLAADSERMAQHAEVLNPQAENLAFTKPSLGCQVDRDRIAAVDNVGDPPLTFSAVGTIKCRRLSKLVPVHRRRATSRSINHRWAVASWRRRAPVPGHLAGAGGTRARMAA